MESRRGRSVAATVDGRRSAGEAAEAEAAVFFELLEDGPLTRLTMPATSMITTERARTPITPMRSLFFGGRPSRISAMSSRRA